MREVVPALLNHCFDRLDTHLIEAIEAENVPSARLAECQAFSARG